MGHLVDVVGHFGTTFSYATVASRVARGLRDAGLLGQLINLDPGWHSSNVDLADRGPFKPGTHVLLFAVPRHYMDSFAIRWGRERSAIFASPNTDSMDSEYSETCDKFGLVIVPSTWCESVVRATVKQAECTVIPLGVDPCYAAVRETRSVNQGRCVRVVHFSTDHFWPGRKGTQELLQAWRRLEKPDAKLTLHLPPSLNIEATRFVRNVDLDIDVRFMTAGHGSSDEELAALMAEADLVVAPSRCEGYGMMFEAALVAGVPLLCTYNTGHTDVLRGRGGWLGVPTPEWAPLAGESGRAPVVEPSVLATSLDAALEWVRSKMALRDAVPQSVKTILAGDEVPRSLDESLWPHVVGLWVDRIREWMGE